MTDTKLIKGKNNESGTITQQILAAEESTLYLTPVPENAPGLITLEIGQAKEELIYYGSRDAGAGTVSNLIRDVSNLNGGVGQQHEQLAAWETSQSVEFVNNIVDAVTDGFYQEQKTVARTGDTTFTVTTDRTAYFTAGRLVRFNQSSSYIGEVSTATYDGGTGLTTVTVTGVTIPNPMNYVELGIQPKGATSTWLTSAFYSATVTLTNKRNTDRVTTIVSNANPTINTDNCDAVDITAQAADIASMTTNLSGTPTNFQTLIIRFKDDGTARGITWGASFEARGVALPTTTVISKVLTVGFIYDTTSSKWGCVAKAQEA